MMEKQAREYWKLFVQQPKRWQDWDHSRTPLAFHDNQRAVLFGHPYPGPGFTEETAEGIRYHVAHPKPVSFTANSAVPVNGVQTATVMWHEQSREDLLALVTHEAFHAYQAARGCPLGSIAVAMKYPVNDSLIQALAEAEAELLYQALTGEPDRKTITAALDARAARQVQLTPEVATFEDEVELGEGLATYIEIKTAEPGSRLWSARIQTLKKLNREAWGAARLRFYYSGMAWGLVCDAVDPGWHSREWVPQSRIAAEALNHRPDTKRRDFPDLDLDEILARQQQEARVREEQMQKTLAQVLPGTGLRVELVTRGQVVGGGWNPMTAVTYPGVGRYHPTTLMYTYDSGASFEIDKNSVEAEPCRHIIFERHDLKVLVDGRAMTERSAQGSLTISGSDCRVTMPRAEVSLTDNILRAEEM